MLNAQIRDNFLETMPGKAVHPAAIFVATGTNAIVERETKTANVATSESTSSTTYVDLTTVGPTVSVTTGTTAFVFISCNLSNDTASAQSCASYAITGATTRTSDASLNETAIIIDGLGAASNQMRLGSWDLRTDLTAGTNVFTMKYRAGGVGEMIAQNRAIVVWPL